MNINVIICIYFIITSHNHFSAVLVVVVEVVEVEVAELGFNIANFRFPFGSFWSVRVRIQCLINYVHAICQSRIMIPRRSTANVCLSLVLRSNTFANSMYGMLLFGFPLHKTLGMSSEFLCIRLLPHLSYCS